MTVSYAFDNSSPSSITCTGDALATVLLLFLLDNAFHFSTSALARINCAFFTMTSSRSAMVSFSCSFVAVPPLPPLPPLPSPLLRLLPLPPLPPLPPFLPWFLLPLLSASCNSNSVHFSCTLFVSVVINSKSNVKAATFSSALLFTANSWDSTTSALVCASISLVRMV